MRHFTFLLAAGLLLALASCEKKEPSEFDGLKTVSYEFENELIANPERGLYTGTSFSHGTESPIKPSRLQALRPEKRTLYMVEFWLKDFFTSDISDSYLQCIRTNLEAFREGGAKCILRFGYSDGIADLSHPEQSGPFDASEQQVLRHIAQLKPILQEYSDIIFVLQAGFVGCWGEWYYTTNFIQGPTSIEDYQPRKHVCDALLDALPGDRQIELRTPRFKMKMYGYALADTITLAESHQPTAKARLGGHNDCILASADDQGTFNGKPEKDYWKAETRYTIMGGETCAMSNYCKCDNTLQSMADQHMTYLNMSYNRTVLNYWDKNGCFSEIKARLGYRLSLSSCGYTPSPVSGGEFRAVIKITNDGFASPMNPRAAEYVITDKSGKVILTVPIESDPRYWMAGTTTIIDQSFSLPSGMSGEYTLWLNLPDPCEKLRDNPAFSIRLSNKNVWDENTGYNKLYSFTI